ncbi:MAG: hypothetical protein IPN26_07860 [Bacteroidetes bacterium]|nr:hypothetical protein [Bacteroidota bacterium]
MKKLFLFLSILLIQLSALAGWNRSMLRIREDRGRTISVSVDGRRYQKWPEHLQ